MKTTRLQNGIGLYCISMGKIFRVTHVLPSTEAANKAMKQDKSIALIAEDNNGLCYLAEQYGAVCPSAILLHHQNATDDREFVWCQPCRSYHVEPRTKAEHAALKCFKPWRRKK